MTQQQLADELDVSRKAVVFWETGKVPVSKVVMVAIRQVYSHHRTNDEDQRRATLDTVEEIS